MTRLRTNVVVAEVVRYQWRFLVNGVMYKEIQKRGKNKDRCDSVERWHMIGTSIRRK